MNRVMRQRKVPAGQVIFSDEDNADFFAIVTHGVVKLSKTLPDGRQQIVGLVLETDFLGRAYRSETSYFAEAASDVELCCFPNDEFERLLAQFPSLERRLFKDTLNKLDSAREWMLLLGRKTAPERIASFLLMASRKQLERRCSHMPPSDGPQIFQLPLSRADMADFLGVTIETVSRQITKLKTRNIIRVIDSRSICIVDRDRLAEIACETQTGF